VSGPLKSRFVRVRVDFIYMAPEPMDGIPVGLSGVLGHDTANDFITAGMRALGFKVGAICPGSRWTISMHPEPKIKETKKRNPPRASARKSDALGKASK
jgi:hypothetical protein